MSRLSKFNPDFSVALERVGSKASYLYPISETNYAIFPTLGVGRFLCEVFGFSQSCGVGLPTKSISSHIMSERKPHIPCGLTLFPDQTDDQALIRDCFYDGTIPYGAVNNGTPYLPLHPPNSPEAHSVSKFLDKQKYQARVVRKVDNAIHRVNRYPVNSMKP